VNPWTGWTNQRHRTVTACSILVAALWLPVAGSDGASEEEAPGSLPLILDAIEMLESASDAKCKATADRLEDFITGTPLSEEARLAKIELQKRWVRRAWARASERVRQGGGASVSAAVMRDEVVPQAPTEGGLRVELPDGGSFLLEQRDVDHYGSVAYSLRALLAVQQEALLGGDPALLPAEPDALEVLRQGLDAVSLAALHRADRLAREAGEPTVPAAAIRAAWREVAGSQDGEPAAPAAPEGAVATGVFVGILERKLVAYRAYNEIPEDADRLFLANVRHYFARYPIPQGELGRQRLRSGLQEHLLAFAGQLVRDSQERAGSHGHGLIRADDVAGALQRITPYRVNEFEDAVFFPSLPRAERWEIESYDMDSFRDIGLHWAVLQQLLEDGLVLEREPDPFAAEGLAEGVAQYGVLLLRIAGSLAKTEESYELGPDHLMRASERIAELARQDRARPATPPRESSLISAAPGAPPTEGVFFTDVTRSSGVEFRHRTSDWLSRFRRTNEVNPPTFSGGGIAAEDVDGDGDPDLLLVGGGGNALLRNDGPDGFVNITVQAGLRPPDGERRPGEARQPLIVDWDNDGLQDILITYVNDAHRLYRNRGGARFEDVTERAGLGGPGLVGGPATAFDFDGDGLLDLYVGYFGNYLEGELPRLARDNRNGLPNRLWRNLGGMRFEPVQDAGVGGDGWTQAVSHSDVDGDGLQDIIVANDYGRNAVLRNQGGGRFEDVAEELGMDDSAHSMNVGIADLNRDLYPDVYISNIVSLVKDDRYVLPNEEMSQHFRPEAMARMRVVESNKLYVSEIQDGELQYIVSAAIRRGHNSTGWAWDADFFDFDNDGDDDLYCVNGANDYFIFGETRYLYRDDQLLSFPYTYGRESNVFFVNEEDGLQDASEASGADFTGTSRSTAYLDYDDDGDLDVAVNNFHGPAVLLRNNVGERGNHWLRVTLQGDPARGSNRDAIGARVVARTASGIQIWREVRGGGGYLSMDPKEIHLGLGGDAQADLRIRWPDGEEQTVSGLQANRRYRIVQGRPARPSDRAAGED
jgi:enediyne biosynthesis protein E4